MATQRVIIGRVGGPHGIRGELKLQLFLEQPDQVNQFKQWFIQFPGETEFKPYVDFAVSSKGGQYYIHFNTIHDRDQARQYTHALLAIDRSELAPPGPSEFYWSDLEGLSVYNQDNQLLGTVDHLLETGANDVMVIKTISGKELLIPYVVPQIICEIDLARKLIRVEWEE